MISPARLIPIAWPIAPEWQKPASLEIIRGTVFNALVATNLTPDFRARASSAGLEIIETSSLAQSSLIKLEPQGSKPVVVTGSLWPHVRGFNEGGGGGPTGNPWVDSNGWLIRIAQAKSPGSPIWLSHTPPGKGRLFTAEDYSIAIADARAWDGRWVVNLDDSLASGLLSQAANALVTWKVIAEMTAWFEQNRPAPAFHPAAKLGIVSDFRNPVVNDSLNLLARRQVPFLAVTPDRVSQLPLDELGAICTSVEPIPEELRQFSRKGLLIRALAPSGESGKPTVSPRFAMSSPNIAVAQGRPSDPYLLATDIHLLMTRRQDVVRLFNGSSCVSSYSVGPRHEAGVEIVNYTGRKPSSEIALQILSPYSRARVLRPDAAPSDLEIRKTSAGSEVNLPRFGSYLRVEFT